MPPEGGQSGSAVLTTITDAKGEKHTAISGILSWRYGEEGKQQWGGGLSLKRTYEIFKSQKPTKDRIPSSWKCAAEVMNAGKCQRCGKAPNEHYVIYDPRSNRATLTDDGKTALYCDFPTAGLTNAMVITYKDYLVKRPGCDRPNPQPGPGDGGPPSEDGPPNGGVWPDELEPNPAPPAEEPETPTPIPQKDPRITELENRIASLNNQIKALEGSNAGLDAQVKVFKDQLAKLEAEKKALEDAKKSTETAKTAAEKAAAEKAAALAAAQDKLAKEEEAKKQLNSANEKLSAEKAATDKKLGEAVKTAADTEKKLVAESSSKEEMAKRLAELAEKHKDSLNSLNIPYISSAFGGLGEFLSMVFGALASGAIMTTIWHKFIYPQLVKRLGWFPAKIIGYVAKRKLRKYIEPEKKSSDETVGSGYNNSSGQDVIPTAPPAPYLQPESTIELPEAMIKDMATRPVESRTVSVSIGNLPQKPVASPKPAAPLDYPTEFFTQNNNSFQGMSVREWAIKSGLYKVAVQKLGAGQLVLSNGTAPANGKKAAQSIEDYVTDRFVDQIRLSNMEPVGNLYHEAYLGFLYWEAVQKLGRGEFSVLGHKEAAEAIDRYVKNEFMKKVR
jgi:hypothetical protein